MDLGNLFYNRRLMKRKSELTLSLDEMFVEDEKKRIAAIKMLEPIAVALGPQRSRDELVPFLNQFWDEEPSIMRAVVTEIQRMKSFLGGIEHEKLLLPTLIGFCSSDEIQVATQATKIIISILLKANSQYVDVVKKLGKIEMDVAKQCMALVIISGIQKVPHLIPIFLQTYKSLAFSQKPSVRIIGAKYLNRLNEKLTTNKDEIITLLDIFYNDLEDLPKLLTVQTLVSLYPSNATFVMNKLKFLISMGKWRFNLKLCESGEQLGKLLTKSHFKIFIEPAFINMMNSSDIQIRAQSCYLLVPVAKNMSSQENTIILLPIMEKFNTDTSTKVKINYAKNLAKLFPYFSQQIAKEKLLPMVIILLKQNNLEISTGIIQNLKQLPQDLKNPDTLENVILKPLASQLSTGDWRLKLMMLTVLSKMITEKIFLVPTMIDLFVNGCLDRVQAIRNTAANIIVDIIKINSAQWCKSQILPKLSKIKESPNYLVRQKILRIIEKTVEFADPTILTEYKSIIMLLLCDRIPNIRMIAITVAHSKSKLTDKAIQNQLMKMKDDSDSEIRQVLKMIK